MTQGRTTTRRAAGRPVSVDPDSIARTALGLFAARGLDAVTMSEVAEASGVSRRTLFRWFPTKAALVWGGVREADERFGEAFRAAGPAAGAGVLEVIRAAYRSSLTVLEEQRDLTRMRMIVIADSPRAAALGASERARVEAHLSELLAGPTATPTQRLRAAVIASAVSAAVFTAVLWWARENDGGTIADTVDDALRGLSEGLAPASG